MNEKFATFPPLTAVRNVGNQPSTSTVKSSLRYHKRVMLDGQLSAPVPIVSKVTRWSTEAAKGNELHSELYGEYRVKNNLRRSKYLDYMTP